MDNWELELSIKLYKMGNQIRLLSENKLNLYLGKFTLSVLKRGSNPGIGSNFSLEMLKWENKDVMKIGIKRG